MKVTNAHLKIAILVLFAVLALYGLLKMVFHVAFGSFVEENLPMAVIVGAVVIFAWNRQIYDRDLKEQKAKEEAAAQDQPQTTGDDSGKNPQNPAT